MAKLKAPLLSFGASGAIAKTQVYFKWKGLNVVRQHVVPTNPNTQAQQDQRAWITEAVSKIHTAMGDATYPLNDLDKSAFSLWASAQNIIMTWFNTIVKYWVDARVAEDSACIFAGGDVTPADTQVTLELHITAAVGAEPTDGNIHYGFSKTSLIKVLACSVADLASGKAVTGLTNGKKYYFQFRPTTAGYTGSRSGIYHGTPAA